MTELSDNSDNVEKWSCLNCVYNWNNSDYSEFWENSDNFENSDFVEKNFCRIFTVDFTAL